MAVMFSIIVPVYNVNNYIKECLDSLISQKYDNYEIIVIDDGSTDGSEIIVDEYIKYKNVKVLHQENRGLSAARNEGIALSTGEYIFFVDSDDYISGDTLSEVSAVIHKYFKPDVVAIKAFKMTSSGKIELKIKNEKCLEGKHSGSSFFSWHCKNNTFSACAPMYICRREYINKYDLRFKLGVLHEDELWTPNLLFNTNAVVDTELVKYYHRERMNSITHKGNNVKKASDILDICHELLAFSAKKRKEEIKVKWLNDRIAMLYMDAVYVGAEELLRSTSIERALPITNAFTVRNRIKAMLFLISPSLYIKIDKHIKK